MNYAFDISIITAFWEMLDCDARVAYEDIADYWSFDYDGRVLAVRGGEVVFVAI